MKNQNGFSLLEVVISLAFFSALVLAGAGWMSLLSRESITSNENVAIANAMMRVRYAFGNDDRYCQKIIGSLPDGSSRPFNLSSDFSTSIPAIDYYNIDNSSKTGTVMKANSSLEKSNGTSVSSNIGSIMVKSILLKAFSKVSANSGVANLEFTFSKSNGTEAVRRFPIFITVSDGAIYKCSTMATTDVVATRKCEISGGGYTSYDSTDSACKPNEEITEWQYSMDTSTAACAPGSYPAAAPNDPNPEVSACRASATVTNPLPARVYSGVVDDTPDMGWRVTWDKTTGSCKFKYVAGAVPQVGTAAIRCSRTASRGGMRQ